MSHIHCDTGREIAQALGLNYVFLCEFIELRSTARHPRAQGGGVHGNAILSKLDINNAAVIEHRHHPVDWAAGEHTFAQCVPAGVSHCMVSDMVSDVAMVSDIAQAPPGGLGGWGAHICAVRFQLVSHIAWALGGR